MSNVAVLTSGSSFIQQPAVLPGHPILFPTWGILVLNKTVWWQISKTRTLTWKTSPFFRFEEPNDNEVTIELNC